MNTELAALSTELKKFTVFQMLLDDDDLFIETEELLKRYDPAMPVEFTEQDMEIYSQLIEADGKESISDLPLSLILYPGDMTDKWEFYFSHVTRYGSCVMDIYAFNQTFRNFINFILSRLETNSPESYAQALYNFYNDPRLVDKLIVNPFNSAASYNDHDEYMLSYIPRELPGGRVAISKEDERRAKDYVRDKLYEALRRNDISVDDFEVSVASERVYSILNITRTAKSRGRPRKTGGEAV